MEVTFWAFKCESEIIINLLTCEEFLHTFTIKICTHKKNPVGSGTTM
jgi:hypothetical protein